MRLHRRTLSILLLITYLPLVTGCQHNVTRPKPAADTGVTEKLAGVVKLDGTRVTFDDNDGRYEAGWIIGRVRGNEIALPADSVTHLLVRRFDALGTAGMVIGVAALAAGAAIAIAAATKESCPFVYSWDGQQYVFDAEPYGGSITRGLTRDDFSALDHLRPVGGEYRLRLVNEVNESQYTDLMELWVIDHPPGVRPVPDEFGKLYSVSAPQAPLAIRDQHGTSLLPRIGKPDSLSWEPMPPLQAGASLRDTITLVFTRPSEATTLKLVARVATASWGSHQIRSLLSRMGGERQQWFQQVDANPATADTVRRWAIREGLYGLAIEVREADGWRVGGILPGGGPFIAEDRVVPIDVSRVAGTEVELRLTPARGFWAFDWFAVDFSPDQAFSIDTLPVLEARDPRLGDVTAKLRTTDSVEHPLPATGDRAYLRFRSPEPKPGMTRTVLLHSRGWYNLRGIPEWTGSAIGMDRMLADPELAARLSGEEFRKAWTARRQ
jgi:hypothetical protein